MPQLAGSECVICHERISGVLSARFCEKCGNPVHKDCQDRFDASNAPAGACSACGGDPKAAPTEQAPRAFSPLPLVLVASALVLAFFAYGLWPSSSATSSDLAGGDNSTESSLTSASETSADGGTKSQAKEDLPVVVIETTEGTIKARLFTDKAPKTTENFIDLVKQKYYDGIIFHRVIPDFMIQTGDPTGTGRGGRTDKGLPAKRLMDEFHPDLKHDRPGILSMANAGPNTGDTQFFITTVETPWLDNRHAVFGEVIEGLDVVRKIERVPRNAQDRPNDPPKMTKVWLVEDGEEE